MAIKVVYRLKLFLLATFFIFTNILWAQEGSQTGGFFLELNPRFVQRFTWTPGEGVMRYEIVIERSENGQFRRIVQDFTTEQFIEVSLSPGSYRYRVIPYDYLNRPGQPTEWRTFDILSALAPELTGFLPESITGDRENTIEIKGSNIIPEAEFFLRLLGSSQVITPSKTEILQDGTGAMLTFNRNQLAQGFYLIEVRNPGGLEASIGYLSVVGSRRERQTDTENISEAGDKSGTLDWYLGVSWTPLAHIHGYFAPQISEPVFHLDSAALHLAMISTASSSFNAGLEVSFSWYSFESLANSEAENSLKSLLIENNLLLQNKFMNQKMAFVIRLGMGLVIPVEGGLNTGDEIKNPLNELAIFANAGLALQWLPLKHFYMEVGINYSYIFILDKNPGCLRPRVGLGARF
ncbi:MAG: hypothetical protein LBU88_01980 [Treponema sp.]|jgi:hypothetical protein|nr:hypothetical protein [Treponema sp.]